MLKESRKEKFRVNPNLIVKGFVEVHEGKIILENKPSGGAKFTITIPVETNDINNYSNE